MSTAHPSIVRAAQVLVPGRRGMPPRTLFHAQPCTKAPVTTWQLALHTPAWPRPYRLLASDIGRQPTAPAEMPGSRLRVLILDQLDQWFVAGHVSCLLSHFCLKSPLLACRQTFTVSPSSKPASTVNADTTTLHCLLQVEHNKFLYVSANVINHQSLVAAHVRLGALTAVSGLDSKWAAQRDECLANTSSWTGHWQCAALVHARCAKGLPLAEAFQSQGLM